MKILKFLSTTVLFAAIISSLNTLNAGAALSDGLGDITINATTTPVECPYQTRSVVVKGNISPNNVCIQTTDRVRFGVYFTGDYFVSVVSFYNDNDVYKLNLECGGYQYCFYSSEHDTLVRKVIIPGTIRHKLEIYRDVYKRLSKSYGPIGFAASYNFDTTDPDYVLQASNGSFLSVGGVSISANGRWLGIEFREKGYGVMNLEDLSLKRISTDFFYYNTGYRPETELAISANGKYLISTGRNAGFSLYVNSEQCGDYPSIDSIASKAVIAEPCRLASSIAGKIQGFRLGRKPVFSYRSDSYSLVVQDNQGGYFNVTAYSKTSVGVGQIGYLALGDSFTSGEGEVSDSWYLGGTNDGLDNCHLSARSYPFLLASWGSAKSVACSGAKIVDIAGSSDYLGQKDRLTDWESGVELAQVEALNNFIPGRIPQIDFVARYQPEVITVGIGGNDIGFMSKLSACLAPGTCYWARDVEAKTQTALEIQSLFYKLVDLYDEIHRVSPDTKIYAIGYPKIIDPAGLCTGILANLITNVETTFIDKGIEYLNTVIKAAASHAGVHYIDIEDVYASGRLCGFGAERAIQGFRFGDDIGLGLLKFIGNESFHPTPLGHQLVASRIDSIVSSPSHEHCAHRQPVTCGFKITPPDLPDYWGMVLALDGRYYQADMVPERVKKLEQIPVSLRTYSIMPQTGIRVSVFSEERLLGEIQSSEDGSASADIVFPSDLPDGFHTLRLTGGSYTGDPITYYQVVYVEADKIYDSEPDPTQSLTPVIDPADLQDNEMGGDIEHAEIVEPEPDIEPVATNFTDKGDGSLSELKDDLLDQSVAVRLGYGLTFSGSDKAEYFEPNYKSDNSVLGSSSEAFASAVPSENISRHSLPDHIYFIIGAGVVLISIYMFFTNNKT